MPSSSQSDPPFRPDDIQVINDLATLQVAADPLRLRLLTLLREAPLTVKELAAELDLAPTKLYYHMKKLEEHALIRVNGTRPGAGPPEKEYRAVAYHLSFADALFAPGLPTGGAALDTFLNLVLDHAREEIRRGARAGLLDPAPDTPREGDFRLGRQRMRLTPDEAAALSARLDALEREYTALHPPGDDAPGVRPYDLLLGLYRVAPPERGATPPGG